MATNTTQQQNVATYSTPKSVADHFEISTQTLWRWRKEDGFPQPLKRGQVVRYNIAAIEAWLNGEVA